MARFTVNNARLDPYRSFKFRVVMDGAPVLGVTRISALARTTEVVEHRDGADLPAFRSAPGLTRYEPITLERGITHDRVFEEWASKTFDVLGDEQSLATYRRDLTIQLYNLQGDLVMAWNVLRCWVSEFQAFTTLDAEHGGVAVERIVVQHEGFLRDEAVVEPLER